MMAGLTSSESRPMLAADNSPLRSRNNSSMGVDDLDGSDMTASLHGNRGPRSSSVDLDLISPLEMPAHLVRSQSVSLPPEDDDEEEEEKHEHKRARDSRREEPRVEHPVGPLSSRRPSVVQQQQHQHRTDTPSPASTSRSLGLDLDRIDVRVEKL